MNVRSAIAVFHLIEECPMKRSTRVWRLAREDFAAREHSRSDTAAFVQLSQHYRDQMEHNDYH
jgi:hypothetical protein